MSNVKRHTESTPTDAAALLAQELQEHREAFESTTSGNSPNILKGLRQARAMGLKTGDLTGARGGQMLSLCDAFVVPSSVTAKIQEMHITINHVLCKALEQPLGLV